MRSLALLATAMAPAAAAAACEGELLHNNICLPAQWPPRIGLTRRSPTPPYLAAPPAVIRVDAGRQLFVDDFLIANATNTRRQWYQAQLLPTNPLLRPSRPWETVIDSGVAAPAFSRGFSGGIWWVPAARAFWLWYGCGAGEMQHFHQGTLRATCLATSPDGEPTPTHSALPLCHFTPSEKVGLGGAGLVWSKPTLTAQQCEGNADCIPGTNIVRNVSYGARPASPNTHTPPH